MNLQNFFKFFSKKILIFFFNGAALVGGLELE